MRIAVNCKNMRGCRGKFAALNLLPLFNVYPEITPHRISDPGSPQKKRKHEHFFKSYRFFKQKKNLFSSFFRLFILLTLDEPIQKLKKSLKGVFAQISPYLRNKGKYD